MKPIALFIPLVLLIGGCAAHKLPEPVYLKMDSGNLPKPNITLDIPGLGPCTDNPDRRLHLDSSRPVNVLVHGCFGSSGQFRGLAQVMAFHGQQTACFTYDDRARLESSAIELREAVDQLATQTQVPGITVIGHSQGALISRKSLTELPIPIPSRQIPLRLVTISGPFSGIESAETCGKTWLYPITLGFLPLSCYIATGAKWNDITSTSLFIREPGKLIGQVEDYLKIDTDERDTCRREQDGRCVESDYIFSLAEQRNSNVETESGARRVEVNAGHVEIVGNKSEAPLKLIQTLQQKGVIVPTKPERLAEFSLMLARVYHDNALRVYDELNKR